MHVQNNSLLSFGSSYRMSFAHMTESRFNMPDVAIPKTIQIPVIRKNKPVGGLTESGCGLCPDIGMHQMSFSAVITVPDSIHWLYFLFRF